MVLRHFRSVKVDMPLAVVEQVFALYGEKYFDNLTDEQNSAPELANSG